MVLFIRLTSWSGKFIDWSLRNCRSKLVFLYRGIRCKWWWDNVPSQGFWVRGVMCHLRDLIYLNVLYALYDFLYSQNILFSQCYLSEPACRQIVFLGEGLQDFRWRLLTNAKLHNFDVLAFSLPASCICAGKKNLLHWTKEDKSS